MESVFLFGLLPGRARCVRKPIRDRISDRRDAYGHSRLGEGRLVGLLISLPDAIVTKSYAPIIASGVIGAAIIGALANRFVA